MINNQFDTEIKALADAARKIHGAPENQQAALIQDYVKQLQALLKQGWNYVLGKENEIREDLLPPQYVAQRNQVIENLQIKLGRCAEKYRAAIPNSPSDKQALADYYETYNELVRVNGGIIALDPDAELPDDLMPKDYVDYWLT